MTILDHLRFDFVQHALIVGILTALCAALIGVPLVLKRYSFIGDGLSHIAFGGLAIASVINLSNNLILIMPLTIAVAIVLLVPKRNAKIKGDAAIAMISVGSLAFGYLIINRFPVQSNIARDVCTSLFGSTAIITLSPTDIWICVAMSVVVIAVFIVFYNRIFAVTFDAEFAQATGTRPRIYEILIAAVIGVVVSLSMRLVGSLLTSALIVFPALSAMRLIKNFRAVVICSAILAVVCAFVGMMASIILGTPVGATIVMANILTFAICYALGLALKGGANGRGK